MKEIRSNLISSILSLLICPILAGCAFPAAPVTETNIPAAITPESPLPYGMTADNTFSADIDNDGEYENIVTASTADEYGEDSVWLYISDGRDFSQTEVSRGDYKSSFLTRTQSGEICVFVSLDRGSEDYETDIYSLDGITPVRRGSTAGRVTEATGTKITVEGIVYALGLRHYYRELLLIDSFALKPVTDCRISADNKEPLRTIKALAVDIIENGTYHKQTLPEGAYICPESTDGASYLIFSLNDGSQGRIDFTKSGGVCYIDNISETAYFDNLNHLD